MRPTDAETDCGCGMDQQPAAARGNQLCLDKAWPTRQGARLAVFVGASIQPPVACGAARLAMIVAVPAIRALDKTAIGTATRQAGMAAVRMVGLPASALGAAPFC